MSLPKCSSRDLAAKLPHFLMVSKLGQISFDCFVSASTILKSIFWFSGNSDGFRAMTVDLSVVLRTFRLKLNTYLDSVFSNDKND